MKSIRRFSRLVIVSALVVSMGLITEVAHADAGMVEERTAQLVNSVRAVHGLPGLGRSPQLDAVARNHSARMAAAGGIFHNGNLAGEVSGSWIALGENVGVGPSADAVHSAFMHSPAHSANVYGRWDSMGLGVVESGGQVFITQVFSKNSLVASYSAPAKTKSCKKVRGRTRCTSTKKKSKKRVKARRR